MKARAWLVVVLGCHSNGATPDAPGGGSADAASDAPAGPAATLTVTKDGAPQAGVLVYFGDDGYLDPGTAHVTDASGVASAFVVSGDYHDAVVTAINPFGPLAPDADELFTFEAVQPGDHLELTRTTPASASLAVTFPSAPSAATYRLHTRCGTTEVTSGATVELTGCGMATGMLLEALDATGTSVSWIYVPDVAIVDGGTANLTGTYQPSAVTHLAFDTLNVVSSQIGIHSRLANAAGVAYDGRPVSLPISYMNYSPTIDVSVPSLPAATMITDVSFSDTTYDLQHFVDWYSASPSHSFDLSSGGLVGYASAVTFDRATRGFDYSYTGGQVGADALRARVQLARAGDRSWQWNLVAPYSSLGGNVRYPTLPTDVHDWNSATADSAQVLDATLLTLPGGYESLRARAFSLSDPSDAIVGGSGRLYYETPAR